MAAVMTVSFVFAVPPAADAAENLPATAAFERVRSGPALLIDVRRAEEWRATGIAAGARTVTLSDPRGPEGFVESMLAAVGGDRSAPVALICATGNRSAHAAAILEAHGFTRIINVTDGMLGRDESKGWIGSGLPVEPCAGC